MFNNKEHVGSPQYTYKVSLAGMKTHEEISGRLVVHLGGSQSERVRERARGRERAGER